MLQEGSSNPRKTAAYLDMPSKASRYLVLQQPACCACAWLLADTIFSIAHPGWDLMNEPRSGKGNGAAEIQAWIAEVAPFAKYYAPRQLITVGEDGFYQASNCQASS